jgi:peroxiredoxin
MSSSPKLNQKAPLFNAIDIFGTKINLNKYKNKYTLLVFLRYSGCPWCNLAIHRLSLEYPLLKKSDCQVIAFVQSNSQSIKENIYDRHSPKPQFPIIADKELNYYKKYNVNASIVGTLESITKLPYWLESVRKLGFKQKKMDGNFFLVPAWFLINNSTGKIVRYERGVSFYNHETFVNIYDVLTFGD